MSQSTSPSGAEALLVDGYSLIFRSHYAHARNPLATRDGRPTSALFGFATALLKLLRERAPGLAFVAFDAGRDTFRRERFADYKANRPDTPEELKAQIPAILELVDALGFARAAVGGFEADDLIGTLAARNAAEGIRSLVVSGDRDLFQIIDERVTLLYVGGGLAKAEEITPAALLARTGLAPGQIPDYKALCGDASDNIPGVPGIGEKTAVALLAEHGTLERIYERLATLGARAKPAALAEHRERAFLARDLARIRRDAPVGLAPSDLAWRGVDRPRAEALLAAHEMPSLVKRLAGLPDAPGDLQTSLF